jgi:hypothetical protein
LTLIKLTGGEVNFDQVVKSLKSGYLTEIKLTQIILSKMAKPVKDSNPFASEL